MISQKYKLTFFIREAQSYILTSPKQFFNLQRYKFSFSKQLQNNNNTYDFIIIGAGSGGCLLANRLSKSNKRILVLEAGGSDNYHWIHIPIGYLYCQNNPRTDWLYKTQPEVGLNGRYLNYPRGKVMGGCSSINGMLYQRGQKQDYDKWSEITKDESWKWDNVLPIFKSFEDYHNGSNQWHGIGGEWRAEKQRVSWEVLDTFRAAAEEVGIPYTTDFNRGDNFGVGYSEVNQIKGWRLNVAQAFLKPIQNRTNLQIQQKSHVTRLLLDKDKKCIGVQYRQNNQEITAYCNNELLLCAGAIGSPQILELSGIGNPQILEPLKIDIVHNLPFVGENLQDHLQLRLIFKVQNLKTLNTIANTLFGQLKIGIQYIINQTGPMSMAPSQMLAYAKSDPRHTSANVEYHIQPLSLDKFGDPLHSFDALTVSVCNLRPTSTGSVHIVTKDYNQQPKLTMNYLQTDEDKRVAIESIKFSRQIMNTKSFQKYKPQEYKPGSNYQSDEEIVKQAGNIGTTIFHPAGTCKMGNRDDQQAVLNSQLEVKGVEGLRIVDASIMPNILSGNINTPILMIAEKISQLIKNKWNMQQI